MKEAEAILLLGEGDFSFSLDVCRYLSLTVDRKAAKRPYRIVCTGIDSLYQLADKYRDADFILGEIRSLDHPASLSISIHHEVNAIVPWDEVDVLPATRVSISTDTLCPVQRYHYVIFNHPHLGKEDAQLHSRFLAHLFYSISHHWLAHLDPKSCMDPSRHIVDNSKSNYSTKPGTFHLTLAKGQCERWHCLQSAKEQGFLLLYRGPFVVPSLEDWNVSSAPLPRTCYRNQYKLRRHQSGQSFSKQIVTSGGSETFIFGRIQEWSHSLTVASKDLFLLPWQPSQPQPQVDTLRNPLSCSVCGKVFVDDRSIRKHWDSVHSDTSTHGSFLCDLCPNPRSFSNREALTNHKVSKHWGEYTFVQPDWASAKNNHHLDKKEKVVEEQEDTNPHHEMEPCKVCSFRFQNEVEKMNHVLEMIPIQGISPTESVSTIEYPCSKCSKRFRDQRAQFQHENFCRFVTVDCPSGPTEQIHNTIQ
jgi:hypothetical protein